MNQKLLSQLLPYDPSVKIGNRLKDGFKEFLLLLITAEEAINSLQKGHLKSFDPLVGENACQIRAIKIALIDRDYHKCINTEKLDASIKASRKKIEDLLESIKNFSTIEKSLKDYLELENLDIPVNSDELFLIKSFILSKTKVTNPFKLEKPLVENATTDAKMIKEISNVGSAFSWNLVKNLRERLSLNSVNFVQTLASESRFKNQERMERVSNKFLTTHNDLQCLPYYWTTQVLMEHALQEEIPIVMIVEQRAKDREFASVAKTVLYFKATTEGYKATSHSTLDQSKPAIILMGSTCRNFEDLPSQDQWHQELLTHNVIDMILAYAATHRQYPNETNDILVHQVNDENYLHHKAKAQEWGCSLINPRLFFLAHAFCDKIRNVDAYL